MKITISSNSCANIHSENKVTVDLSDLGFTVEEWKSLTDSEKDKEVLDYIFNTEMFRYWFEEHEEGEE